jgi:hypothetical protein
MLVRGIGGKLSFTTGYQTILPSLASLTLVILTLVMQVAAMMVVPVLGLTVQSVATAVLAV